MHTGTRWRPRRHVPGSGTHGPASEADADPGHGGVHQWRQLRPLGGGPFVSRETSRRLASRAVFHVKRRSSGHQHGGSAQRPWRARLSTGGAQRRPMPMAAPVWERPQRLGRWPLGALTGRDRSRCKSGGAGWTPLEGHQWGRRHRTRGAVVPGDATRSTGFAQLDCSWTRPTPDDAIRRRRSSAAGRFAASDPRLRQ